MPRQRKCFEVSVFHLRSCAFFTPVHASVLRAQLDSTATQLFTVYSVHTDTHTYPRVSLRHSSCLVCFEYRHSSETVSNDEIVAKLTFWINEL